MVYDTKREERGAITTKLRLVLKISSLAGFTASLGTMIRRLVEGWLGIPGICDVP